jgi:ribosomal-protein-alanine N-acetyltransferase
MKFNFTPFPTLTTKRLTLRAVTPTDRHDVLFNRSNEEINKYIKRKGNMQLSDADEFIKKSIAWTVDGVSIYWCITLQGSDKMIGSICLWNFSDDLKTGEVGYGLTPEFQGRGIMSEAMEATLSFGFNTTNFVNIEAFTHLKNEASIHLLEKHGFRHDKNRVDEDDENNLIFTIKNPTLERK